LSRPYDRDEEAAAVSAYVSENRRNLFRFLLYAPATERDELNYISFGLLDTVVVG